MAPKKRARGKAPRPASADVAATSSSVEALLLAALSRGEEPVHTGRYLVTFKEGAEDAGAAALEGMGLRTADARDFSDQSAVVEDVGDADSLNFPEIGVALISGPAAEERGLTAALESTEDSVVQSVDPELFVFPAETPWNLGLAAALSAAGTPNEYLRGFRRAAEVIAQDLAGVGAPVPAELDAGVLVSGATWGLIACRVPPSPRSGAGIKVAVLDTGMDLGHPDFAGRPIGQATFVGQPVQDLHSHGTHCIGTALGPAAPAGTTPRYGVAYRGLIYAGKVLSNSGTGAQAGILAGINWAIAQKCAVISMSLGSQSGPHPAYTAAGQAALLKGSLIVAAAGNAGAATGAPANSPTIMSVASLDPNLAPSSFSNFGKIEIAAPGRDVYSSVPRPTRYGVKSGTSMATPHVAGCAALWAESSAALRARALWQRLQAAARPLPYSAARVGAGLVRAP